MIIQQTSEEVHTVSAICYSGDLQYSYYCHMAIPKSLNDDIYWNKLFTGVTALMSI